MHKIQEIVVLRRNSSVTGARPNLPAEIKNSNIEGMDPEEVKLLKEIEMADLQNLELKRNAS
mgnify:CR=1 FL=1